MSYFHRSHLIATKACHAIAVPLKLCRCSKHEVQWPLLPVRLERLVEHHNISQGAPAAEGNSLPISQKGLLVALRATFFLLNILVQATQETLSGIPNVVFIDYERLSMLPFPSKFS
jgi:hypothetical protein